jgi:hypothetical protein
MIEKAWPAKYNMELKTDINMRPNKKMCIFLVKNIARKKKVKFIFTKKGSAKQCIRDTY